jgi:hypothetical protein
LKLCINCAEPVGSITVVVFILVSMDFVTFFFVCLKLYNGCGAK